MRFIQTFLALGRSHFRRQANSSGKAQAAKIRGLGLDFSYLVICVWNFEDLSPAREQRSILAGTLHSQNRRETSCLERSGESLVHPYIFTIP